MFLSAVWVFIHRILSNEWSTFLLGKSWSDPSDATRSDLSCSNRSAGLVERIALDEFVSVGCYLFRRQESTRRSASLLFENYLYQHPHFLAFVGFVGHHG